MKHIKGIGGVFFKTKDPEKIRSWYSEHLGIEPEKEGHVLFKWKDFENPDKTGYTVWSPFPDKTEYFDPSKAPFMVNYIVENLEGLIKKLEKDDIRIIGKIEEYDYGKFAWIIDPEGNKIELWEPK